MAAFGRGIQANSLRLDPKRLCKCSRNRGQFAVCDAKWDPELHAPRAIATDVACSRVTNAVAAVWWVTTDRIFARQDRYL